MQTRFMVRLAAFGIMGGLLMFFGDLCFYMRPVSGADFIADPMMNKMAMDRLIVGGVVGPLAGLLYALGSLVFYFAFSPYSKLLARMVTTLFVVMFVVGGAYHSVHATYGFVGNGDIYYTVERITGLIKAMHSVSFVAGLGGSLMFVYMVLKHKTIFPKWIVIFTPTFWTLLNMPMAPYIPYPAGAVVIGGWVNLCFIAFFGLCYVLFSRQVRREENN